MAISSYSELQASISDWLNRTDLASATKNFIALAEAQFQRSVRHRYMVTRSQATIDSEYSSTPADWLQTVSLILETNPVTQMEFLTNEALNGLKAGSSATGRPNRYTHVGTEIQVFPAPDNTATGYTGELVYYARIPALSDSNTSNWLLDYSPDIYLYGALMQSAPYLQNDERITIWSSLYLKAIDDLEISNQRTAGQTSVKMRAAPLQ